MQFSQESKVGVFVVTALTVLLAGFFFLKGKNLFRKKGTVLYTVLRNTEGLYKGSGIRINGVDAGKVTDVRFTNEYADAVLIEMELDRNLKLPANSVATVGETLLGSTFIDIEPGDTAFYGKKGLAIDWLKNKDTLIAEMKSGELKPYPAPVQEIPDTQKATIQRIDSLKPKQ